MIRCVRKYIFYSPQEYRTSDYYDLDWEEYVSLLNQDISVDHETRGLIVYLPGNWNLEDTYKLIGNIDLNHLSNILLASYRTSDSFMLLFNKGTNINNVYIEGECLKSKLLPVGECIQWNTDNVTIPAPSSTSKKREFPSPPPVIVCSSSQKKDQIIDFLSSNVHVMSEELYSSLVLNILSEFCRDEDSGVRDYIKKFLCIGGRVGGGGRGGRGGGGGFYVTKDRLSLFFYQFGQDVSFLINNFKKIVPLLKECYHGSLSEDAAQTLLITHLRKNLDSSGYVIICDGTCPSPNNDTLGYRVPFFVYLIHRSEGEVVKKYPLCADHKGCLFPEDKIFFSNLVQKLSCQSLKGIPGNILHEDLELENPNPQQNIISNNEYGYIDYIDYNDNNNNDNNNNNDDNNNDIYDYFNIDNMDTTSDFDYFRNS
eukprot:TRINITY_DN1000_c0_g1_i1.p1 TRINITY_DN1000_c0_g1~~TRINITY_DN1000_c0_g1_i1.p1  ORF type:complete len:426 (+),score=59.41 TRINITY_DN1000_c0_g1_i1:719-1996(+)